jgi:hypothetical protein
VGGRGVEVVGARGRANEREGEERRTPLKTELLGLDFQLETVEYGWRDLGGILGEWVRRLEAIVDRDGSIQRE